MPIYYVAANSFILLLSSRLETVDCRLGKLCSRSTQIYNTLFQLKRFIHSKLYSLVYFFVFSIFYKMVEGEMTYENQETTNYNGI